MRRLLTLLFITLLLLLRSYIDVAEGSGQTEIQLGIYPGGETIEEYERDLNTKFDHVLEFQSIKALDYSWIIPYLDKGYNVILNVEFLDSYANLKGIAAGKYDAYLIKLCDDIKRDGRPIWLRTLHEFNGEWYNWGVFYPGNSKDDFVPAWRHVVQVIRSQNAPVKIQLNINANNGLDDKTPFSAFWPGDDWMDMVVMSCYNRAYIMTDSWPQMYWKTFSEVFTSGYNEVAALTQKPMGIAEMGSSPNGGNKTQWIIDAFKSIVYDFPRLQQVTWFLSDWTDLNTNQEKDAFRQGISILKNGPTLSIAASPEQTILGESVTISGFLTESQPVSNISIQYRQIGSQLWNTLAVVKTNSTSGYSYEWIPTLAASYELKAAWLDSSQAPLAETTPIQLNCLRMPTMLSIFTSSLSSTLPKANVTGVLIDQYGDALRNETVILSSYSLSGGSASLLQTGSDTTDSFGDYSISWTPSVGEDYLLKAEWAGNATHESVENTSTLSSIAYNNYVFSVESNSTITQLGFNSTDWSLGFKATGSNGTSGYCRITVDKSLISDPDKVVVRVDGVQTEFSINDLGDKWTILFAYGHSTHNVVADLDIGVVSEFDSAPIFLFLVMGLLAFVFLVKRKIQTI
jgi:hypothetical protein